MATRVSVKREERARPLPVTGALDPETERFVVECFAQYQGVGQVHRSAKEALNLEIDHRTLMRYDPDRPSTRYSPELQEVFDTTRAQWTGSNGEIGIAQQSHRLRLIQQCVVGAMQGREWNAASKLIELAAKEMGGMLTNVSTVEHKGTMGMVHLNIEDVRAELSARLSTVATQYEVIEAKPLVSKDNPSDLT